MARYEDVIDIFLIRMLKARKSQQVLLASVLIYNSQSVPTRRDLEGLEYPFKCSNNNEMFILTMKVFFKLQSKITSQSTICEEESRLNKDNLVNF